MNEEQAQEGPNGALDQQGPPASGDARVDEAVAGLSRLSGRPVEEHVAVLEEVHGQLRDILEELAENQGSQG